jgi:hypothetical protein
LIGLNVTSVTPTVKVSGVGGAAGCGVGGGVDSVVAAVAEAATGADFEAQALGQVLEQLLQYNDYTLKFFSKILCVLLKHFFLQWRILFHRDLQIHDFY